MSLYVRKTVENMCLAMIGALRSPSKDKFYNEVGWRLSSEETCAKKCSISVRFQKAKSLLLAGVDVINRASYIHGVLTQGPKTLFLPVKFILYS